MTQRPIAEIRRAHPPRFNGRVDRSRADLLSKLKAATGLTKKDLIDRGLELLDAAERAGHMSELEAEPPHELTRICIDLSPRSRFILSRLRRRRYIVGGLIEMSIDLLLRDPRVADVARAAAGFRR